MWTKKKPLSKLVCTMPETIVIQIPAIATPEAIQSIIRLHCHSIDRYNTYVSKPMYVYPCSVFVPTLALQTETITPNVSFS
jgi:hypothetical protein